MVYLLHQGKTMSDASDRLIINQRGEKMGPIGSLMINVVLTAVVYMAFPLIKLCINHGRFQRKRARRIALWNSIVLGAFFCILTISGDSNSTWNAAPAFLYYWINCVILTDKTISESNSEASPKKIECSVSISRPSQISDLNETLKSHGKFDVQENDIRLKPDTTTFSSKSQFCRRCGNKLSEDALFCNKCGTKVIMNEGQGDL